MVDAGSGLCDGPKVRDWAALKHEGKEDSQAADEDDGSDSSDETPKFANNEDSPVEEQNPDFDGCYSEGPEHHEDI